MRVNIHIFLLMTCFIAADSLMAQLSIDLPLTNYTIDFDNTVAGVSNGAYDGTLGFQPNPNPGQLDSDAWAFEVNGAGAFPDYDFGFTGLAGVPARGSASGGVNDGGVYSFFGNGITTGQALGIQPSSSTFDPVGTPEGYVSLKLVNNTGSPISTLNIDYLLYVRNDFARSNSINPEINYRGVINEGVSFRYAHDMVPLYETTPGPPDAVPAFIPNAKSTTVIGLYIEPGDSFEIRWRINEVGTATGNRDEFAFDNIQISAGVITGNPIFYTQPSSINRISGSFNSSPQEWSTVPTGGASYRCWPLLDSGTYVIQNGFLTQLRASGTGLTLDNLIVEAGGRLIAQYDGYDNTIQRYLNLHGDIICDGQIGSGSGLTANGSGIGFNLEPGNHTISGSGVFDCSRIRKSNQNLLNGQCNLTVDMDITLLWNATGLYNDRQASGGGTNLFNVHINPGSTVTVIGDVSIDGTNALINSIEAGGSIDVEGTLDIGGRYYSTTNNNTIPCSLSILNGGRVNVGYIISDASGAAGHTLTMEANSILDITDANTSGYCWENYSATNNTINLLPNSSIYYSKSGNQFVLQSIEYRNLRFNGSANKTVNPAAGDLRVHENLIIWGSSILQPAGQDIHVSGDWTSYSQLGFNETGVSVLFDAASGSSTISCGGAEVFHDVDFNGGDVDLNADIDILNDLDLFSRVNLNSHDVLIRVPANTTLNPPTNTGMFVSEDITHQGTISVNVSGYTGPVDFPFGTTAGVPIYSRLTLNSGNAGRVTMATYGTVPDNTPWPIAPTVVNNLNSTTGLLPDNRDATADRFWSISSNGSAYDANLELSLTIGELPIAPYNAIPNLIAQRYDSSTDEWKPPLPGQSALSGTISPSTVTVSVPNVTAFSPWAVASSSSPLPVELMTFEGSPKSEGIQLSWTTSSEINNSHFVLKRFGDDSDEKFIGEIEGNGNSSASLNYDFLDRTPLQGWNYYRLLQYDFDGTESDEGLVSVWWGESNDEIDFSVQTVSSGLILKFNSISGPYTVQLIDNAGRELFRTQTNSSSLEVPLNRSQGTYILRVDNGHQLATRKIVWIRP